MKIHLGWIRVTATAAIVAGVGAMPAAAQYAPYRPIPQKPAAQPAAPQTPAEQPTGQPRTAQQPAYQQAVPAAAPTAQTPYVAWQTSQVTAPYQPVAYQPATPYQPAADRYQTTQYPQTAAPAVPAAPYVPTVAPAQVATTSPYPAGYPTYPAVARQPDGPMPTADPGMPAPEPPANGDSNGSDAQNGYNGHTNGHAVNGYATTNGCDCNQGYADYGVSQYFGDSCYETQWFGGMYFLFMERDNATPVKLTVEIDHSVAPDPYYPNASTTVLGTHFVDHDYREGVEVRFGSTFTISEPCDTCNTGCYSNCNSCAPCAVDVYAWEVAWWGIDDDVELYTFVENDNYPDRIYGMKNFAGLEYDRDADGTAENTVNAYYGYLLPIPDPGAGPYADGYVRVLAQHVRTNFKAQNLELNIIRFPVCQVACGGGNSGCNSCDGYGAACGCEEECCPSSFSMYGSCGVRYFRVDDDFMYANEFAEWAGGTPDKADHDGFYDGESNEMYYDVQVENHLVGPQVGWTMNYNYACKWNFFCNSTFGLFNNHIEHCQQMWGGGGGEVRFVETGGDFYVESNKDDISFLGELRLGGSYDISCNWRAVLAYRAIALAGVATSTDQIPDEFTNAEWVAIIDSDNSMIIHGVQAGAECRY
jgi:hypothetical protein